MNPIHYQVDIHTQVSSNTLTKTQLNDEMIKTHEPNSKSTKSSYETTQTRQMKQKRIIT